MAGRRRLLTLVAAGVLALAACADDSSPPADAEPDGGPAGPADLSFTVPTVDGGSFEATSLAGQPAVLWFWAPWCVICAGQASDVSAMAEHHDGQANVVGVAGLDDSVEAMQQFVDDNDVANIPHLADVDGVVWQRFEITQQSTFVVLDADGQVVNPGTTATDDAAGELERLVS